MRAIGFVLHPTHNEAATLYKEASDLLSNLGIRSYQQSDDFAAKHIEAVVSLGGDGTMLRALQWAYDEGVPALGINLGQMGYLSEVEPEEMIGALQLVVKGTYSLDERLALRTEIATHQGIVSANAFNEVVVERETSGHVIRSDAYINDQFFLGYETDGLIVSTPTGSTAYNFSARGPILSPALEAIVLTPLSPHMLFDRSLILDSSHVLRFRIRTGPRASVMIDGQVIATLQPGDEVSVERAERKIQLVKIADLPFYELVKRKFKLNGGLSDA